MNKKKENLYTFVSFSLTLQQNNKVLKLHCQVFCKNLLYFFSFFFDNKNMEEIDYKAIFNRIKWMIQNDHRTQKELAEYLGKTRQIFYDWQNNNNPTLIDLFKISKFFGVPLEYIISGEESPIDDATAAFLVQTRELKEEQKKIIYASIKAQVDMFKQLNKDK